MCKSLAWKRLTYISRKLLILTTVFFVVAVYVRAGYACSLDGGCGAAFIVPGGAIVVGNYWPLIFVPGILTGLAFLFSLRRE